MTILMHHHQILRNQLEQSPDGRIVVRAPVGSGLAEVLAHLAVDGATRNGLVAVVTQGRALVEQWTATLQRAGALKVRHIGSSTDLLIEIERSGEARPGLGDGIVVISADLLSKLSRSRQVGQFRPALLIVDNVIGVLGDPNSDSVNQLAERSARVVVASHHQADLSWLEGARVIDWIPPAFSNARSSLRFHTFPVSQEEVDATRRAWGLLQGENRLGSTSATTWSSLHATLLRIAARAGGDSYSTQGRLFEPEGTQSSLFEHRDSEWAKHLDDLWEVADALEAVGEDRRLAAMDEVVLEAKEADRTCVVLTDRADDAEYVAAHLRSINLGVGLLTGMAPPGERETALHAGDVIVMTTAVMDSSMIKPARLAVIWWSPPRTALDVSRRLEFQMSSRDSETVALLSNPPLPADALLADLAMQARSG